MRSEVPRLLEHLLREHPIQPDNTEHVARSCVRVATERHFKHHRAAFGKRRLDLGLASPTCRQLGGKRNRHGTIVGRLLVNILEEAIGAPTVIQDRIGRVRQWRHRGQDTELLTLFALSTLALLHYVG